MRRNSALLVALLFLSCVVAVGASATVAATQPSGETNPLVVSVNDTANYLSLPDEDVDRQTSTDGGLSLGTAIATDTAEIQGDVVRIRFEQSFDQAANDSAKTAAVDDFADRVEQRKQSLERRNRNAISAYASGSMSAGEFSRERARISNEANRHQRAIERVKQISSGDASYSLSTPLETRLDNIGGELEVLQGPVSGTMTQVAAGAADGQSVYVEASSTGYTMAYVTDGLYFRETYLGDQRKADAPDQFAAADVPRTSAAELRGYEEYPWLVNNSASPNTYGHGTSGIYRFTSGELTAHLDGGTTNVFREAQRQKLASMPTSNTVTNTNNSLRLRLNKTYETGPLEISLRDNETNESVDGTILVNGEEAGHTGEDGRLWVVEPRGPDRIKATTERGNVSVFIPS